MIPKPYFLIVEDDEDIQEIYKEMLSHAFDADIEQQYNGLNGINAVKKRKPEFIILDLLMPVMSGDQFLAELRDVLNIQDVPVLVCSVNQTLAHKLLSEKKANAVLPKLFKESELIEVVTRLTMIQPKGK
ncbi:MAG: response regulator [Candidatus Omnitrophica bacterium]|nr:response regulator [Candidatus Omnitrophota bacterium]